MTLLTGSEAGRLLRISPHTVREMIRSGELDGFVRPRTTRVVRDSIDRLLRKVPTDGSVEGNSREGPRGF
jgi:excisionase family DNA binding protein